MFKIRTCAKNKLIWFLQQRANMTAYSSEANFIQIWSVWSGPPYDINFHVKGILYDTIYERDSV